MSDDYYYSGLYAEEQAEAEARLTVAQQPAAVDGAIDMARFERAPCYLCGYNGPARPLSASASTGFGTGECHSRQAWAVKASPRCRNGSTRPAARKKRSCPPLTTCDAGSSGTRRGRRLVQTSCDGWKALRREGSAPCFRRSA